MMSTINYKIPKIELVVDLLLDQLQTHPEEYIVFLNQFSRYRKGPESIAEFLNKDKHFIPLKHVSDGRYVVANLNQLVYVREKEEIPELPEFRMVKIFLENKNVELTVQHFAPLPDSQARVLDYLNDKNKFVVFYHNRRRIHVNKDKILCVEEL